MSSYKLCTHFGWLADWLVQREEEAENNSFHMIKYFRLRDVDKKSLKLFKWKIIHKIWMPYKKAASSADVISPCVHSHTHILLAQMQKFSSPKDFTQSLYIIILSREHICSLRTRMMVVRTQIPADYIWLIYNELSHFGWGCCEVSQKSNGRHTTVGSENSMKLQRLAHTQSHATNC